jgi:hypothetical protein
MKEDAPSCPKRRNVHDPVVDVLRRVQTLQHAAASLAPSLPRGAINQSFEKLTTAGAKTKESVAISVSEFAEKPLETEHPVSPNS